MNSIAISACQISASIGNRRDMAGHRPATARRALDQHRRPQRRRQIHAAEGAGGAAARRFGAGQVQLLGRPLARLPARERARQLAWLGQNEGSADDLTVLRRGHAGPPAAPGLAGPPSAADHAAVEQALRTTQAWDWRHRPLGAAVGRRAPARAAGPRPGRAGAGAADGRAPGQPRPAPPGRLAAHWCARWWPRAARWSACCTRCRWRCRPTTWW
jgi:hypothetical protein